MNAARAAKPPIDALKAVAHPARFRILSALGAGRRNVGEIEELTGIGQPALSQQLAVLRQSGLVRTRRKAKLVYYAIDEAVVSALADALRDLLGPETPGGPAEPRSSALGAANFARLA